MNILDANEEGAASISFELPRHCIQFVVNSEHKLHKVCTVFDCHVHKSCARTRPLVCPHNMRSVLRPARSTFNRYSTVSSPLLPKPRRQGTPAVPTTKVEALEKPSTKVEAIGKHQIFGQAARCYGSSTSVITMASKYAAAHVSPKGPGDARPTALQIIHDEGLEGKLKDKTFLITGCSSGIGVETARAIAATGATVYCTVRDIERGKSALKDFLEPGRVELLFVDLSSLESVRTGAKEFLSKTKGINVLICNAGVMAIPAPGTTTADGFETQFGTNHLGHFLLFNLLKDSLIASSTPEFNSRVVMVASSGHRTGGVRFDDYGFKQEGSYNPWASYGQSKTANIYMANYIDRHFGQQGIHTSSLNPGGIWTPLQKHMPEEMVQGWKSMPEVNDTIKSTEQGAATTVWAAVGKEWEGKGGKYLENVQVSPPVEEGYNAIDPGYAKHAYDEEKEDKLWVDSLKMVGLAWLEGVC